MAKDKQQPAEHNAQEAPKKKPGKFKLILLVGLLVLVLGGGGFAAYAHFFAGGLFSAGDTGNKTAQGPKAKEEQEKPTEMVSLPKLLVNLADPLGKRYLKVAVNVEVRGKQAARKIKKRMPRVKDSLILLFSSKAYDDLSSMGDKISLKSQIAERLNQVLEQSVVKRVYFTEFIVQ